jgi:hypothetical protein
VLAISVIKAAMMIMKAYMNQQINFFLLCHNRVGASTEPAWGILQHVELL